MILYYKFDLADVPCRWIPVRTDGRRHHLCFLSVRPVRFFLYTVHHFLFFVLLFTTANRKPSRTPSRAVLFSVGTARSPTLTWSGIRRRGSRRASVSCATRIKGAPFWQLITLTALRYNAASNFDCHSYIFVFFFYIYELVYITL